MTIELEARRVIAEHAWDPKTKSCKCGWSQRQSLPRGMEQFNHPLHVADILARAGLLRES